MIEWRCSQTFLLKNSVELTLLDAEIRQNILTWKYNHYRYHYSIIIIGRRWWLADLQKFGHPFQDANKFIASQMKKT